MLAGMETRQNTRTDDDSESEADAFDRHECPHGSAHPDRCDYCAADMAQLALAYPALWRHVRLLSRRS
jgi:hypothetical protein